jgi:C4-dicarboxylate transporter, DctQ subunit
MSEIVNKEKKDSSSSSFFEKVNSAVSHLENISNYIAMLFITILMLMVVVEVFARYVINYPIEGYIDFMEMFMVVVVFFTLSICQREGGHIRMELFINKILKGYARKIASTLFLLVSFFGIFIITIYSWQSVIHSYHTGDSTLALHMATWPARLFVPIGCGLLCARFLLQICQQFSAQSGEVSK